MNSAYCFESARTVAEITSLLRQTGEPEGDREPGRYNDLGLATQARSLGAVHPVLARGLVRSGLARAPRLRTATSQIYGSGSALHSPKNGDTSGIDAAFRYCSTRWVAQLGSVSWKSIALSPRANHTAPVREA